MSTAIAQASNGQDGWRRELEAMRPEWQALFPSQQHLDRFRRVVATAVASNPDLLNADRRSLWQAATMAAQDELQPDGREGALVIYNVKFKEGNKEVWRRCVRWMPMVAGILKKIRRSGELLDISVQPVHEADRFTYQLGDDPKIVHVPEIEADDRGELRFVYAIARTKDGGVYREVMSRKQVDAVRAANKNGKDSFAWKDWYEEMARKSVLRRISKFLPMGAEIEAMFHREEEEQASAIESVPLIAETRMNSRQSKINGVWEKFTADVDACETADQLDDFKAHCDARVAAMPGDWQEQAWEYIEKRSDAIGESTEAQGAQP